MSSTESGTSSSATGPRFTGSCHALYAFDLGYGIGMAASEQLLKEFSPRLTYRHKGRVPQGSREGTSPLRIKLQHPEFAIGKHRTLPDVEVSVFEFGALCVNFTVPVTGTIDDMTWLSTMLYRDTTLIEHARSFVRDLARRIAAAIEKPSMSEHVEDYVIFHFLPVEGHPGAGVLSNERGAIAQMLRAEDHPISREETMDATDCHISYAPEELVVIDWYAALLIGKDMADERLVLELATVELLELRFLDATLDRGLGDAYRNLLKNRGAFSKLRSPGRDMDRIARLEMDNALLLEGVDNALKLVGDDYLARTYRLAAKRFHFDEWERSIGRKLASLQSAYGKLADLAGQRRAEVLEWIIIFLILFEIVMAFVRG